MVKISATTIAASESPSGYKLWTGVVTLPAGLLPELETHKGEVSQSGFRLLGLRDRDVSRSLVSARAVPTERYIDQLTSFTPLHWGKAQPGMQAQEEELEDDDVLDRSEAIGIWQEARSNAIRSAELLDTLGVHKQIQNRLLLPFAWCTGVISATSQEPGGWPFANFLGLRAKSAKVEPHMHELSWCIADAINGAHWEKMAPGGWHLPFVEGPDLVMIEKGDSQRAAMASAMRCARASYNKLDGGTATIEEDAAKARTALLDPKDVHGSPFEHQAKCPGEGVLLSEHQHVQSGNFKGWVQFRKTLPGERSTFTAEDYTRGRVRVLRGSEG